jgi:hypothetical protein
MRLSEFAIMDKFLMLVCFKKGEKAKRQKGEKVKRQKGEMVKRQKGKR